MEKKYTDDFLITLFQKCCAEYPQYIPLIYQYINNSGKHDLVPSFFTEQIMKNIEEKYPKECALFELDAFKYLKRNRGVFQKSLIRNQKGVEILFKEQHQYFLENFKKCIDYFFFRELHNKEKYDYVKILLHNGYYNEVSEELLYIDESFLEILFLDTEVRDYFINDEFAHLAYNIKPYFQNLPFKEKGYVAYYEPEENIEIEIEKIFENNFQGLLNPTIQKNILDLWDTETVYTKKFIIEESLKRKDFWPTIYFLEENFMEGNRSLAINFLEKRPLLVQELLTNTIDKEIISQKIKLIKNNPNLTFSSFLENAKYLNKTHGKEMERVSPSDYNELDESPLKYMREVAIIKPNGEFIELYAKSHEKSIIDTFPEYGDEATEVRYRANIAGNIILTCENAAILAWLPPVFTTKSLAKLQEIMESILEKKEIAQYVKIAAGIASLEYLENYILICNGMYISIEEFLKEFSYFTVNDNYVLSLQKNSNKAKA